MARRPVVFFNVASIKEALDAAETEADRQAVFGLIGDIMTDELDALERDREGHRPAEVHITRRPVE